MIEIYDQKGMPMEIRHLRTFKAVATLLSFNKAAEELHYAQSSVSAQIQILEEELGVRLFDRLGRSILLTDAGARLLPYAQKMLDLSEETLSDISGTKEPIGHLIIRVPESMAACRLPQAINHFHLKFPNVRITFTTCTDENLRRDLRKGVTDLAFLLTEGIRSADLETKVLGFEPIVVIAAPHHPLASKSLLQAKHLEGQTILLSEADCSYRKVFEQTLKQQEIECKKILSFHSVAVLKACIIAGLGITILPEIFVSRDIERGRLVLLPYEEGTFEVAILMVWYKKKWLSPALKAFMDVVKLEMKKVFSTE